MEWKPIISEETNQRYREKLDQIAAALFKESAAMERIGLIQGKAGVALFFFYYAELSGKEIFYDTGVQLISDAIEKMGSHSQHTFGKGEAGIGWVIEHLAGNRFVDLDTNKILTPVDEFISRQMEKRLDQGLYDLINGALGDGQYFLARSSKTDTIGRLSHLLDRLDQIAFRQDDGCIAWKSIIYDLKHKPSGINLGLLFGIAGVIAFLSKLIKKEIDKEKALDLINGTVRFLLKHARSRTEPALRFPGWAGDSKNFSTAGLALGYGDLSAGLSLWLAAAATDNRQWRQIAADTMLNATSFKDLDKYRVMDASLTSGTSGIAHVYNRMYHYTGEEKFGEAARYWLDQTLKMADNPSGYAGFLAWRSKKSKHKDKDFALIEGIAGIGLVLISALSQIPPAWDECVLLS